MPMLSIHYSQCGWISQITLLSPGLVIFSDNSFSLDSLKTPLVAPSEALETVAKYSWSSLQSPLLEEGKADTHLVHY